MADDLVRCQRCGHGNQIRPAAAIAPWCRCGSPLAWVTVAGEDSFASAVAPGPTPVLVDLRADWCPRCRLASPVLDRIARDFAGLVKVVRVDVERAPALARRLSVEVVPTLLAMRDAEVVARRTGVASATHLRRWVGQVLGLPVPQAAPVAGSEPEPV